MWKQSGGACYFSLKAAVLFKRDFTQVFNSLQGLFGQAKRIRHFAKIKAIFHSLFYSSCRAPVVVIVFIKSDFFSSGLKIFYVVSVASILKGSNYIFFGIRIDLVSIFSSCIWSCGRTNTAMVKSHKRHTLQHTFWGWHPHYFANIRLMFQNWDWICTWLLLAPGRFGIKIQYV